MREVVKAAVRAVSARRAAGQVRAAPGTGLSVTACRRVVEALGGKLRVHHHERVDGKGYPDKLVGAETTRLARLMAIVDVYDALRTERPYKRAVRETDSLRIMHEGARSDQFDPELVRVFLETRGGARPAS